MVKMVKSQVWHTESLHQGLDMSLNLGLLAWFAVSCPASNLLMDTMPNIPIHELLLCGSDRGVERPLVNQRLSDGRWQE